MKMTDSKICLEAFNQLCEELSSSELVSAEEFQYWMFERGYKAALNELIGNIAIAAKSEKQISLEQKYLVKEEALH